MAYTLAQYTALCEAISQGVLSVEFGDKKTQYRSLAEMYEIKRNMEKELSVSNSGKPARKFASFSKGL